MDYEYYYNNARSRYYNACSEINSCVNRINALNSQKWHKANYINQLKTGIKNYQDAFNDIEQILKNEEILNQRLFKISNATDQATVNYNNMISSDNIVKKNLNMKLLTGMCKGIIDMMKGAIYLMKDILIIL